MTGIYWLPLPAFLQNAGQFRSDFEFSFVLWPFAIHHPVNSLFIHYNTKGAVALTCGSSFYISNTKRRASKSPAFVV